MIMDEMMWPDHNEIPLHTNLFARKLNLFLSVLFCCCCCCPSNRAWLLATVVVYGTGDFCIGIKIRIGLRALIAHDSYWRLATGNFQEFRCLGTSSIFTKTTSRANNTKSAALNCLIIVIYLNVISVRSPCCNHGSEKNEKYFLDVQFIIDTKNSLYW